MYSLLDYIAALENKIQFIIKLKRKQIKLMSELVDQHEALALVLRSSSSERLPQANSSMRRPPIFSVLLSIYITQRYRHFKEKPLDSMKIPNTSETRIVSHTLHFKLCPAETKDQPKSVCVSIRNIEGHQQLTNVYLNLKSMYLFHMNKLPINHFFSLLLHISPGPSGWVSN